MDILLTKGDIMYNHSMFTNSFMGYYVDNYNEVLNYAAPTDGSPILFANLNEGMLWSKKIVNGISMVQAYRIMPINQEGKAPEIQTTNTEQKLDKLLELLLKKEGLNETTVNATDTTQST